MPQTKLGLLMLSGLDLIGTGKKKIRVPDSESFKKLDFTIISGCSV